MVLFDKDILKRVNNYITLNKVLYTYIFSNILQTVKYMYHTNM